MERGRAHEIRPGDERLLGALTSREVHFEVLRIENWTLGRCGPRERDLYYHLVRVLDSRDGTELARAALKESGILFTGKNISPGDDFRFVPIAALADESSSLTSDYGLHASSAQYVATTGSLDCHFLTPCVAFRDDSDILLWQPYEAVLFRIKGGSPTVSFSERLSHPDLLYRELGRLNASQRLICLGGDICSVAELVSPESQRVER